MKHSIYINKNKNKICHTTSPPDSTFSKKLNNIGYELVGTLTGWDITFKNISSAKLTIHNNKKTKVMQ